LVDQALDLPVGTTAAQDRAEVMEFTLQFRGTKEQLMKLRQFMTSLGIPYQKLKIFNTANDAMIYRNEQKIQGVIEPVVLLRVESAA
jgi:hypothetical protein